MEIIKKKNRNVEKGNSIFDKTINQKKIQSNKILKGASTKIIKKMTAKINKNKKIKKGILFPKTVSYTFKKGFTLISRIHWKNEETKKSRYLKKTFKRLMRSLIFLQFLCLLRDET